MGLSPDNAKKVLEANLVNLAKRVAEGQPLTAQQLLLVKAVAASPTDQAEGPTFARNQVELANLLGCHRRSVQRWMKQDGNPGAAANGKYNVAKWREWAETHGHMEAPDSARL